jgi:hypothetical protein
LTKKYVADSTTRWRMLIPGSRFTAVSAKRYPKVRRIAIARDLLSPIDVEQREREGSPFGALFEFQTGRLPPPLGDVPDEDVAVWVDAFDEIGDPRLRSRIGDLLWERRVPPRYDLKAREACEALLSLGNDATWGDMESTEGLVRALELARAVSDEQLERRAVDALVTTAEEELSRGAEKPGITYTLLEAVARLPAMRRPSQLRELVDRTEQVYGHDPFHFETTIDLLAVIACWGRHPSRGVP